jgi:hypothetical protein
VHVNAVPRISGPGIFLPRLRPLAAPGELESENDRRRVSGLVGAVLGSGEVSCEAFPEEMPEKLRDRRRTIGDRTDSGD